MVRELLGEREREKNGERITAGEKGERIIAAGREYAGEDNYKDIQTCM